MGKKSKTNKTNKTHKLHIKVKQQHIYEAHEKLRLKFNSAFQSEVPMSDKVADNYKGMDKGIIKDKETDKETDNEIDTTKMSQQKTEKTDKISATIANSLPPPADHNELLERLTQILDFYRSEKISSETILSGETVNPVDLAYNTLCDEGIKNTINHGQQLQIPGEKLRLLFLRGYYGRENLAEQEEKLKKEQEKEQKKEQVNEQEQVQEPEQEQEHVKEQEQEQEQEQEHVKEQEQEHVKEQ